jgi:hypothetical protein
MLDSMANKRGPKGPLTDEHKAAMAAGRVENKVVRDYLEALRSSKPKRGRKRTPESIAKRLEAIEVELVDADALAELELIQERFDLEAELAQMGTTIDISALESDFVKVAKSYSTRKGISYAAWRQVGVEPGILRQAGISRSS